MRERSLRNCSHIFSCFYYIARLCCRSEFPLCVPVERVNINTPLKKPACFLGKQRKWVLQTVVDFSEKTRPKLRKEKVSRELNNITCLDSFCHFINLKLTSISADTDYFTLQAFTINFNVGNFVHGNNAVKFDRNHVSINADYLSFCIRHLILQNSKIHQESYCIFSYKIPYLSPR